MKKVFKKIAKNWKTTLAGITTIVISLFVSKGKLSPQDAAAITGGIGLILSKDADKTDSAKPVN